MEIYSVPLGITQCYLIRDKGTILVDCGPPGQIDSFLKGAQRASIDPRQVDLIIQTHGHSDHIGSAKAIKHVTGAKIAMHDPDREWLEQSLSPVPPGVTAWGRILVSVMSLYTRTMTFPETKVEVLLPDEDFPLEPFGIAGKVVYTPGHTMGSVSVLLDTGDAFTGDLVMNRIPLSFGPGFPFLAEDIEKVKTSCRLLLDYGAKTFYPGHGKPFPAEAIRRLL